MARKRKKEMSQGIACYLCQDGSVADTRITIGDLLTCVDSFPNKLFTIESGRNLQGWPKKECLRDPIPLVTFKERKAYAEFPEGERTTSPVLHVFGNLIGQTIIVCEACCTTHEKEDLLEKALHAEFDRRLAEQYGQLCKSLFDHDLLHFDIDALERFVKNHGPSIACQHWLIALQEIHGVAPHEHIQKVHQRLAPLLAAFTRAGKGTLKVA